MRNNSEMAGRKSGWRRWIVRIALTGGILLILLGLATWLAGSEARSRLVRQYPPPGERVDVGGFKLHLNCIGQGNPTVILEAGLRSFSVHWALVQPEVARFTRVCAYDRAGLGWSDPGPLPRTSEVMVQELHTLLVNAQVPGPYLLVGHSFGGLNVRLFAHHFPDEVAGLVLVDAVHEELDLRISAYERANAQLNRQFRQLALLRGAGIVALFPQAIPEGGLPAGAFAQYGAILATTRYFENATAESLGLETSYAQFRAAGIGSLGEMPLFVLSRSFGEPLPGLSTLENQRAEEQWQQLQAELAALSSNGERIMAETSGHNIPLQQPELVVEAIRVLASPALEPAPSAPSAALITASKSPPSPSATVRPEPLPSSSPPVTVAPAVAEIEFTLRTQYEAGRMLYVGVGGDIDGIVSPDLVVPPGALVHVTLVNGDGILHDLFFPDFAAQSAAIGGKKQSAEVAFTVSAEQRGSYVYYCTFPGHREAGQEGWLFVEPAE